MKKALVLILGMVLFGGAVFGQEKTPADTSRAPRMTPAGEILLDAFHVEAHIEKPSVSIVPKPLKADLHEVEFIWRDFHREIYRLPEELFTFVRDKRQTLKIRDVERLIDRPRGLRKPDRK
jgi:hypothetical protein